MNDPELKLFWHYHLYHLICVYLTKVQGNVKQLGDKITKMRKRCWYFLCHFTYNGSLPKCVHFSSYDYTDEEFQSGESRYLQAHTWYMNKEIGDYTKYVDMYAKHQVNDTKIPIDQGDYYWKEVLSSFQEIHRLIEKTPAVRTSVKGEEDPDTTNEKTSTKETTIPVHLLSPIKDSIPSNVPAGRPIISASSSVPTRSVEEFVQSTLLSSYLQTMATAKYLLGNISQTLLQVEDLGKQLEIHCDNFGYAYQHTQQEEYRVKFVEALGILRSYPEVKKPLITACNTFIGKLNFPKNQEEKIGSTPIKAEDPSLLSSIILLLKVVTG